MNTLRIPQTEGGRADLRKCTLSVEKRCKYMLSEFEKDLEEYHVLSLLENSVVLFFFGCAGVLDSLLLPGNYSQL